MSAVLGQAAPLFGLPRLVSFCRRCVMSNQRPNSTVEHANHAGVPKQTLHLDAEGVCDACRVTEAKATIDWGERERELLELLARHRSKSGAYDCVVPGSGGKDSFYAAHVLKTKYGMHPLLVTWAPHMATEWGVRNLERWQAIADHVMVTPNRTTHRLLTRLALENLFHPFQPFILGQKNLAPKIAASKAISLVFYGENEAEYGNPKKTADNPLRDAAFSEPQDKIYLGGCTLSELGKIGLTNCDLEQYVPSQEATEDTEIHYLGYYLKWHPQSAYYYAAEHGGFECAPERSPGTYSKYNSIDDKVDDLHYWTTFIKFGIGRATYDAAQEIRSGEITREEGVSLVRKYDGEYPQRFEKEVFEYLSVPGFKPMDRRTLMATAERFRSPHLWQCIGPYGTWELRHRIEHHACKTADRAA